MRSGRDIVDEIDALVDEQLANGEAWYDRGVQSCPNCGEDWHTLPIRERMREIRMIWRHASGSCECDLTEELAALEAYRYAEDRSPILCPGSDVAGPVRALPMAADRIVLPVNWEAVELSVMVPPWLEELNRITAEALGRALDRAFLLGPDDDRP